MKLLDYIKEIVIIFLFKNLTFPKEFHEDLIELTETVVNCVEAFVLTVRSFFRDIKSVRDNAHKVTFYEKESDIKFSALSKKNF